MKVDEVFRDRGVPPPRVACSGMTVCSFTFCYFFPNRTWHLLHDESSEKRLKMRGSFGDGVQVCARCVDRREREKLKYTRDITRVQVAIAARFRDDFLGGFITFP